MEVDIEELKAIADNYEIPLQIVLEVYNTLKEIPCTKSKDEYTLAECVERVIQGLSTNEYAREFTEETKLITADYTPLETIISDALFHIYGDASIPYLEEEYKKNNQERFGL